MQTVTKEQYTSNPCGSLSTAYWKSIKYPTPSNITVVHERDYDGSSEAIRYFRLLHNLCEIKTLLNSDFEFQNVNLETQKKLVARILSECYKTTYTPAFVDRMTKTRVFDSDLWVFIIEKSTTRPVALGIADFDAEIKEGSLEWIQVLPGKRGNGLGNMVVNELLSRLKTKADFATVSGQSDNDSNPEILYRNCGFKGNDIWYVIRVI